MAQATNAPLLLDYLNHVGHVGVVAGSIQDCVPVHDTRRGGSHGIVSSGNITMVWATVDRWAGGRVPVSRVP